VTHRLSLRSRDHPDSGLYRAVRVTGAPSLVRALEVCSLFGLGEGWGDGQVGSLGKGHHDTAAPGSAEAADRHQKDAPQSASQ
jgi:hypothetical protein